MKLRNKKTGKIFDWQEGDMPFGLGLPHPKTLAELNEEWEDYKPDEPLITDEKVRKAVKAWAEANDYEKIIVRVFDYDRCGICCKKSITSFISYETRLGISFFNAHINIKTEEAYTITELCGEEEE